MAEAAQSKRRASAWPGRLILHLLLLSVAAAFLFPFAWMLLTAAKTDEEIAAGKWLPALPQFRSASPYWFSIPPLEFPDAINHPNAPTQTELWMSTGDAVHKFCTARNINQPDRPNFLIWQVIREVLPRVPKTELDKGSINGLNAYKELLTDQNIEAALAKITARIELRQLQLRSLNAQIANVISGPRIAEEWKVEKGNAKLKSELGETVIWYSFSSPSDNQIVLRHDFEFPFAPADLHKLILSLKPDDSWHRIDAELTIDGQTWRSTRSSYLAQHRPTSIIFQPPTFEDETYQPKIWVPLRVEGSGFRVQETEVRREKSTSTPVAVRPDSTTSTPSQVPEPETPRTTESGRTATGVSGGPSSAPSTQSSLNPEPQTLNPKKATLRIILTPSSTSQAIWGKLTRNYVRIFNSIPFWKYLANSLLLVVLTVTGTLFSSTFVAYAFARLHWPGRSIALLILLSTLMLPEQVTMIPSFLIWQKLGWYNTLNPIWVPTFFGATFTPLFGSAFFIYLMVQHMRTLPKELEEAARIDGLGHVQTWWYIMLPQVKPAAAAIATLSFLAAWNDFLRPLIYLRDQGRFPLSLGLLTAQIENRGDWTMIMAGNILMTLPVILLFFLAQRSFVRGMSGSGLK